MLNFNAEINQKYTPKHNGFLAEATSLPIWSRAKEGLPKLTWFLPFPGPLIAIVVLLFGPCLFSLLINFVSFRLQQFEGRLMMAQGVQLIPAEWPTCLQGPKNIQQGTSTPLG